MNDNDRGFLNDLDNLLRKLKTNDTTTLIINNNEVEKKTYENGKVIAISKLGEQK